MDLTIAVPDDIGAALEAEAHAYGLSVARYASRVIEQALRSEPNSANRSGQPFETGYGMWAKYGPAPSAEDIAENRREMFQKLRARFGMIAGGADTHSAIWFLFGDARLSAAAKNFFDQAALARQKIALSPISLAEVVYLIEKDRLPLAAFDDLTAALRNPNHVLHEAPLTSEIVESMREVARSDVPDLPDRIVSATAIHLGVPLITRDAGILASSVNTIW